LQSHYLFDEHFCLVGRPNEKGQVEGLVGFTRRNFLVPVPRTSSLEALNEELQQRCRADLERRLRGQAATKAAVRELVTRGLLVFDAPHRRYDLHPIVRQYAYDRLGDKVVDELVGLLNDMDATFRAELRELNERNFQRFEAKLEERVGGLDAALRTEMANLRAELRTEIANVKADLIKWMFLFWVGTLGTLIALLKLWG